MATPYRPPGRSNRSGRSNADNDVFEGLPVKQWNRSFQRVSLAPPVAEIQSHEDQKWTDPPMPRDYQLLNPWTQQLLRLARSGRVGTKRKQDDPDAPDEDKPEDEIVEEVTKHSVDERGYVAKKWRQVPEALLEPEHKHFEFLAKRRRGLPSLYGPDQNQGMPVPMRKTKVQRTGADGEIAVYEVLVPEGQTIEGEVNESTELADVKPVIAAPGTAIEGVGIANEEGVLVAEHLKPSAPRRNRPPPKKKGGPGRGKKRVTFTNPDGSTYTTVVPNATKIVPQPGQTVKHVAKGEEASADVTAEEAAAHQASHAEGEEGSGSDEGEDDGDDDDGREDGELSEDDAPGTGAATPAKPTTPAKIETPILAAQSDVAEPMEDVRPSETAELVKTEEALQVGVEAPSENVEVLPAEPGSITAVQPVAQALIDEQPQDAMPETLANVKVRGASSSPDFPLAATTDSRSESVAEPAPLALDEHVAPSVPAETVEEAVVAEPEVQPTVEPVAPAVPEKVQDGDDDLLGNLERFAGEQDAGTNDPQG